MHEDAAYADGVGRSNHAHKGISNQNSAQPSPLEPHIDWQDGQGLQLVLDPACCGEICRITQLPPLLPMRVHGKRRLCCSRWRHRYGWRRFADCSVRVASASHRVLGRRNETPTYRPRNPAAVWWRRQSRSPVDPDCAVLSKRLLGRPGLSNRARNLAYARGDAVRSVRSKSASSAARRAASMVKSVRFFPTVRAASSIRPRMSVRMRMLSAVRFGRSCFMIK